jgi:hypothetical protein
MVERQEGLRIEEVGTGRFPSLEAAQEATMPVLAEFLAKAIRSGVDSGRYIVENGVVKPCEEVRGDEQLPAAERRPRVGILP